MTGLLARVEFFPNEGTMLPVPVEYLVKLMFIHQPPSDLVLYNPQKQRLGTVHLQPERARNSTGYGNLLVGTGAIGLTLPGMPKGRLNFRFTVEIDEARETRRFDWASTLHLIQKPAASLGLQFDGRPPLNQFHYAVRRDQVVEKEASGTLESLLSDPDLAVLGFDPAMVLNQLGAARGGTAASSSPAASRLVVTARRGSLSFNGESIETYVVRARYADALESTLHLSQLGQVLSLKTFAGYDLYDETLPPP